jgi:hypothetical protein
VWIVLISFTGSMVEEGAWLKKEEKQGAKEKRRRKRGFGGAMNPSGNDDNNNTFGCKELVVRNFVYQ